MAIRVICHPQPTKGTVRTADGLLGQVVVFPAAAELWDNPSSEVQFV